MNITRISILTCALLACGDDTALVDAGGALDGGADAEAADVPRREDVPALDAPPSDAGADVASDAGADTSVPVETPFDLNDVSFLLPLPTFELANPSAGDDGEGGEFMSMAIQDLLPEARTGFTDQTFRDYSLVGVRVDHCFQVAADSPCERQIRLVFQGVDRRNDPIRVMDATLHMLYALDDAEFAVLAEDLRALRARAAGATDGEPLDGVHPVLATEGLSSEYGEALMTLVRDFATPEHLSRVAIMNLGRPGVAWEFLAFTINSSPLGVLAEEIEGLAGSETQSFFVSDTATLTGNASPTSDPDQIGLLASTVQRQSASEEELLAAAARTHEIENPEVEVGGSVDCVGCHMAGRFRGVSELDLAREFPADGAYENPRYNLQPSAEGRAQLGFQRHFGYGGASISDAFVSARVSHESAEVADALRALSAAR